jgi:pSer/pThr/pTyr-binding forkhead associated (FHA) protein
VLIGRDTDCDVVLDDPTVSRQHLSVDYDGGWVVRDLESTHGSWLGEQRLLVQPVDEPMSVRLAGGPVVQFALDWIARTPGGQETVTVGRALDNDIVLSDLSVSRYHARLDHDSHGWQLLDLSGHNRTLVSGVPVAGRASVVDGDVLTFGSTDILFIAGEFRPILKDP